MWVMGISQACSRIKVAPVSEESILIEEVFEFFAFFILSL